MWSALSNINSGREQNLSANRVLLVGESKTGKTSIAFRMAYDVASEGSTVLFICVHNKMRLNFPLIVSLPLLSEDKRGRKPKNHSDSSLSIWSPAVLSRIMFKYVSNSAELKKVCASIHMLHPKPQCVIVDDITLVIDPMSTVSRHDLTFIEVCQTLGAFIVDAVDFLDKALALDAAAAPTYASPTYCKLVITSDCSDSSFINMMLRYTAAALMIQPISGDDAIPVINFSHSSAAQNDPRRKGVKISVRNKLSVSAMEDNVLFSSVVFSSGQLVCTIPVDHLPSS